MILSFPKSYGFLNYLGNALFPTRNNLRTRKRTHIVEKPFICDQCGKTFSRQKHLLKHIKRMHTVEKPFKCDQCGKGFGQKRSLQRHKGTHTREKYDQCGRGFSQPGNLLTQKRTRSWEKPFVCSQTDKCSQEGNLHLQKRKHTQEIQALSCKQCGRNFTHGDDLQTHESTPCTDELSKCEQPGNIFSISELLSHVKQEIQE